LCYKGGYVVLETNTDKAYSSRTADLITSIYCSCLTKRRFELYKVFKAKKEKQMRVIEQDAVVFSGQTVCVKNPY